MAFEQVRQFVLTSGDVISAPELTDLESAGRDLRSRFDRAQDCTSKLLNKLGAAHYELSKLRYVHFDSLEMRIKNFN